MTTPDRVRLALNLREARVARGISQTAAAKAVGKTRGTIVNWENPKITPEPDSGEVAILAALYGVSSRDLRFSVLARQSAAPVEARTEHFADLINPTGPNAHRFTEEELDEDERVVAERKRAERLAARKTAPKKKKAG